MTSRKKAFSKSRGDRSDPGGSSSRRENVAPKVEFSDHSIDPEERDAYWAARGKRKHPRPVVSSIGPDLPIEEEEDESSMDEFVPCKAPVERERSRNRKDKHIVIDDDEAGGGCFPETLVRNYFDGESFDLEELLGSNPPEAEGGFVKGPEFTKASRLVSGLVWSRDPF
ncbi:hypothetical protein HID58_055538 [Brassica napus]|uniref:Uncharacterized protein n=1 Tax=Brassica napus TaxID=3708 RepID=A0ABQ8AKM3_BRANA|nr:hypothetical protein HID58_055538 [Brassica napus]